MTLTKKLRDKKFHERRRMFCVMPDDRIVYASPGTAMSHSEWFMAEGWCTSATLGEFLGMVVRGFFLDNCLHFYIGGDFRITPIVRQKARRAALNIVEALADGGRIRVYAGPRDAEYGPKELLFTHPA